MNDEDTGVDDEERAINLKGLFGWKKSDFARSDLKKALKDEQFKLQLFQKWDEKKYTVGVIRDKLKVDRVHPRYAKLHNDYLNMYKKAGSSPTVKQRQGKRVRFNPKIEIFGMPKSPQKVNVGE